MTHVVSESCIRCKYTDCVDVCPVDCFVEGPNFLAIDPDGCIDCAVCIPECPVNAIYAQEDLPADQQHMTALNAELYKLPGWKTITKRKVPLPDAEDWKERTGKLAELQRTILDAKGFKEGNTTTLGDYVVERVFVDT